MSALFGVPVVVSDALPMDPSPGTWARRSVRHGMSDILEWLGEDVGPAPDVQTHTFLIGTDGRSVLYASAAIVDEIEEAARRE